jgi:hypothetical protein
MPDSLRTQLSELAGYASVNAHLDTPAALRQHGTRRGWRRRGGAALLGVGIVAAAVVGIAHPGATGQDVVRAHAASVPSAQLTAYQTAVLAKAHVTKAEVAALAKSGLTTAQINAVAAATARLSPQQQSTLTNLRIAVGYLARYITPAERAALNPDVPMVPQLLALAHAHLSAAQLAALSHS